MKTTRTPAVVNTSVFAKATPDKSVNRQKLIAAALGCGQSSSQAIP